MFHHSLSDPHSRRSFLRTTGAGVVSAAVATSLAQSVATDAENVRPATATTKDNYDTQAKGIRILPGQWRPHYPWEHIAWVSPSWPCQDYLWLDFPEAIFTNQGLLFLSHINPPFPTLFSDLPNIPWKQESDGISFERQLPNGISFGGSVRKESDSTIALELHLKNDSPNPLKEITLQTCTFLRAIKDFNEYTTENKYVHVPTAGWVSMNEALKQAEGTGKYRVGWRTSGKTVADLPVMVVLSRDGKRLVAMTWHTDTLSMVSNPKHPCFHADPQFVDLAPGAGASIHGNLIFHEGPLETFQFEG
jgi:hypothetical protein